MHLKLNTIMIQSVQTDRSGQKVQSQIRLLLEEQSDQGLYCLQSHLHLLTKYSKTWLLCLNFSLITAKLSGVRKFRSFTVARIGLKLIVQIYK